MAQPADLSAILAALGESHVDTDNGNLLTLCYQDALVALLPMAPHQHNLLRPTRRQLPLRTL